MEEVDLLDFVENGGCSAKIPAKLLEDVLVNFQRIKDPNLLVGVETHDDAGVYRINDDLALIFTTDFFPPLCSDPYEFGQIAATNSISDIYAMGGEPMLALNISMFPKDRIPLEVYANILQGGADKAFEANTIIVGGHTIDDAVPKYGLAVIGKVEPSKLVTNSGLTKGQKLLLTKPLGTGIAIAAYKMKIISDDSYRKVISSTKQLNNVGAKLMRKYGVRGATDITGFGLLGHLLKMCKASGVGAILDSQKVPFFDSICELVAEGCIPCAAFKNMQYIESDVEFAQSVTYDTKMILCDAQTSGGLLMGVNSDVCDQIISDFNSENIDVQVIGEVVELNTCNYINII